MSFLLGLPGKMKTLLDRLTAARAGYLDNLAYLTGTPAPSATALSNVTWTDARAAYLDFLAAGAGRWVSNPKHLPIVSVDSANTLAKSAASTNVAANNAAFFTALALEGAQTSIVSADTYVTVASITGSGFLFNCVAPTHTASFTPTIRITRDGTQYVIAPTAPLAAGKRLLLGPTTGLPVLGSTTTYAGSQIILPNGGADPGFQSRVGGVLSRGYTQDVGIPDEQAILSYSMPVMRFESSLIIEMKASLLSGTAVDKQCAATYRIDL